MGPKSIVFVRHAQSVGNIMTQDERAVYPIPNHAYPLTSVGVRQAKITGKYIRNNLIGGCPNLCFQSTFQRTQMTMDIILREQLKSPAVLTDSRLDEKWDGIYHDLSRADIERLYPEQDRLRDRSGYYHYRAPGGESCPDTELRIISSVLFHGKVNYANRIPN